VTINRSKGLLGTLETTNSGSESATPIKAYLISKLKDLESKVYRLRNRKIVNTKLGVLEKKGSLSRTL
jgi:hypothetical protein